MVPYDPTTLHVAIAVGGFVLIGTIIGLTIYLAERNYRSLRHMTIQAQRQSERNFRELQHGTRQITRMCRRITRELRASRVEAQASLAELKRLDIVIGGMVYQEDEKTRALVTARFDEMLRLLPR